MVSSKNFVFIRLDWRVHSLVQSMKIVILSLLLFAVSCLADDELSKTYLGDLGPHILLGGSSPAYQEWSWPKSIEDRLAKLEQKVKDCPAPPAVEEETKEKTQEVPSDTDACGSALWGWKDVDVWLACQRQMEKERLERQRGLKLVKAPDNVLRVVPSTFVAPSTIAATTTEALSNWIETEKRQQQEAAEASGQRIEYPLPPSGT